MVDNRVGDQLREIVATRDLAPVAALGFLGDLDRLDQFMPPKRAGELFVPKQKAVP
jgi:hypothetical protein